jgi:hypothetical protein
MIRKYNPVALLVRSLNAADRWMERMDYAGKHHQALPA